MGVSEIDLVLKIFERIETQGANGSRSPMAEVLPAVLGQDDKP
jgi:hypothetical protein